MSHKKPPSFELRNGTANTLVFIVQTTDLATLRAELAQRYDALPGFFANEAVAIDLRRLENEPVQVAGLSALLRDFCLRPIGMVLTPQQREWAGDALPCIELLERRDPGANAGGTPARDAEPAIALAEPPPSPDRERIIQTPTTTRVIDKPLRSGQQIYASGDLVVLAQVSFGAELIAAGSIHIYAPLYGRALAGVHGDQGARIFCTRFEPELIAIAGVYRTAENPLPGEVLGKPGQVRLENEKLIIEPLQLN